MQEMGPKVPLEEEMATHSSVLAWGNPMDGGAWQAIVHGVKKESGMPKRLRMHARIRSCPPDSKKAGDWPGTEQALSPYLLAY